MIRISKNQVLGLHQELIKETGGSYGVRDEGLLESALTAPFQSFGNSDLYKGIPSKAARLCFGLVKNHAMIDGNKRLSAHIMLLFLELNGITLQYNQYELVAIILGVASGAKTKKIY